MKRFLIALGVLLIGLAVLNLVINRFKDSNRDDGIVTQGSMNCPFALDPEAFEGKLCGEYTVYDNFDERILKIENTCPEMQLSVHLGPSILHAPRLWIPGEQPISKPVYKTLDGVRTRLRISSPDSNTREFFWDEISMFFNPKTLFDDFQTNFAICNYVPKEDWN